MLQLVSLRCHEWGPHCRHRRWRSARGVYIYLCERGEKGTKSERRRERERGKCFALEKNGGGYLEEKHKEEEFRNDCWLVKKRKSGRKGLEEPHDIIFNFFYKKNPTFNYIQTKITHDTTRDMSV